MTTSERAPFADEIRLDATANPNVMVRRASGETGRAAFAGHLAAQMVIAASRVVPMPIRSISSSFLRRVDPGEDTEYVVDTMHAGRAMAALRVTAMQGLKARAVADLIAGPAAAGPSYIPPAPIAPAAADCRVTPIRGFNGEVRIVDEVDLFDAAQELPPHVKAWVRDRGSDPATTAAHLALVANSFIVGAALLPHRGLALGVADLVTTIASNHVTYHQAPDVGAWLLLDVTASSNAHGWTYGTGAAHTARGGIVASFGLQALVRPR
jgi:acyl-CoA thioesterase II